MPMKFLICSFGSFDRHRFKIKPMFGCYAIYADGKLCLFMARQADHPNRTIRAKRSLCRDDRRTYRRVEKERFPGGRIDLLKDNKVWMFFADGSRDFEIYAIRACGLITASGGR